MSKENTARQLRDEISGTISIENAKLKFVAESLLRYREELGFTNEDRVHEIRENTGFLGEIVDDVVKTIGSNTLLRPISD